jgi:5-hydroxyisourate hydrolase-like protein (transthyretin family)
MIRNRTVAVCVAVITLFAAVGARAGTLRGTVKNGTTGAPAAGVEVLLLQLQSGMDTVANTKTDAQGAFSFNNPSLGERPMLVRAVYQGVNFHQAVPPGRDVIQVEVFEISHDPQILQFPTRVVILQPNGASLLVGEEYTVQNTSTPPQAYFRAEGSFDIQLPDKAELQQVSAWGPSAMPVVQATIDRGPNKYAIAFAFRPGENGVRLSYQIPYAGSRATVRLPSVYSAGRLLVAAPPGVDVRADGLQASGTEQGMMIYTHDPLSVGKALEISIAGAGSPAPASAGGAGRDSGAGAAPEGSASVQVIPGRLDALKWPLVAGFASLFALGAFFLFRKRVPAGMTTSGGVDDFPAPKKRPRNSAGAQAGPASSSASASLTEVDAQVETSLDALKDKIFRLELRRQAGTISEEEYARERAKTEQILRELVRG